jgi:hypothetical protein
MNVVPPSTTHADPFVRGLARRLGERAAGTDVGPVPLEEIRARIARRRQRRRMQAGAAGLLAVLVLGLVMVATLGERDRDAAGSTERLTLPLLGFANDTWTVVRQSPGAQYAVVDGPGADAVALIVTRDGADLRVGRIDRTLDRSIENMRGILQVGTISLGGDPTPSRPAVWWAVAPGFTATVTGNAVGAYTDPTELLAATVELVEVDEATWQERGGSVDDVQLDAPAPTEPSPLW